MAKISKSSSYPTYVKVIDALPSCFVLLAVFGLALRLDYITDSMLGIYMSYFSVIAWCITSYISLRLAASKHSSAFIFKLNLIWLSLGILIIAGYVYESLAWGHTPFSVPQ